MLHPTKTRIVDMSQSGNHIDFLGYRLQRHRNKRSGGTRILRLVRPTSPLPPILLKTPRQPESRRRKIRPYGSAGGAARKGRLYPYQEADNIPRTTSSEWGHAWHTFAKRSPLPRRVSRRSSYSPFKYATMSATP